MREYKIFEQLVKQLEAGIDIFEDIMFPYKGFDPRNIYKRQDYYQKVIDKLENNGFIIQEENKFYLTLKGKLRLMSTQKIDMVIDIKKWDGIWRILAFDIPETNKKSRSALRNYLYLLGFKMIQRSIWITPYNISYKDILSLMDSAMEEKLIFLETKNISNENQLKKIFDLK